MQNKVQLIYAFCISLVILQILDFYTTFILLNEFGEEVYELNYIIRVIMSKSCFYALLLKVGVTLVFIAVSLLWLEGKLELHLKGFLGEINDKIDERFGLDKKENRAVFIFTILIVCNLFYSFIVINNLIAIFVLYK